MPCNNLICIVDAVKEEAHCQRRFHAGSHSGMRKILSVWQLMCLRKRGKIRIFCFFSVASVEIPVFFCPSDIF